MASWKRHFKTVNKQLPVPNQGNSGGGMTSSKFSSVLPEIFSGQQGRIQRYYQFEEMSRDSDIAAALDTIADFCTQSEEQREHPFNINFKNGSNETEVKVISEALTSWVKKNNFKKKLWKIFRDTIKNGDTFFIRDPETHEWLWLDHYAVELVKVGTDGSKIPDEYVIRNYDPNLAAKSGTPITDLSKYRTPGTMSPTLGSKPSTTGSNTQFQIAGSDASRNYNTKGDFFAVKADHIVHLSLSEGMDINFPFGASILEPIFKTYKQKELLEDSILIYRVQRSPERRIFYIDVGDATPASAHAQLERIKNDIQQRRIPNMNGGSSVIDAAYNPVCLDLETRIPLLDGRTLSINELIVEHQNGKENWAYSCHPITGGVLPGLITWAGVTKKNASTIKLTFDNGKTLICTPDHKIPVLGKGFVEAQHLTLTDSLISFETEKKALSSSSSDRTYERVFDHELNEWVYTHRMVGDFFRHIDNHQEFTFLPDNIDAPKNIIHHKDFNRYNNDPRNLTFMNKDDHLAYHVHSKKEYWDNIPFDEKVRISNKISNSLKIYNSSMSEQDKVKRSIDSKKRITKTISEMKANNPDRYKEWRDLGGRKRSEYLNNNKEAMQKWLSGAKTYQENFPNRKLTISQDMLSCIVNAIKIVGGNRKQVINYVNSTGKYEEEFLKCNPPIHGVNDKLKSNLSDRQLTNIIKYYNFKNWKDLVAKSSVYNHKLISIEKVDNRDVGTITIDFHERWNPHHTFAIEAGIFVKNSMLDDYFFAQTAEGRGSKVETLGGGESLGEIGDLTYFTKKMARGLRIPTSYLSLGGEEQGAVYNDGKLGQSMVEEFRFNKYCIRLQNLLAPSFDRSFKDFLDRAGVTFEEDTFELEFNPPQNFSKYRQIEIDMQQTQVFSSVSSIRELSKRFKLKRYLGLSEEEILENETLWKEENPKKMREQTGASPAESNPDGNLGSMGITDNSDPFAFDNGGGDMGGGDGPPMDMDTPPAPE